MTLPNDSQRIKTVAVHNKGKTERGLHGREFNMCGIQKVNEGIVTKEAR